MKEMKVSIKKYVSELVDRGVSRVYPYTTKGLEKCAMSDIERVELAGKLLTHLTAFCPEDIGEVMMRIAEHQGFSLVDLIADFLQEESDLNGDKLLEQIKYAVVIHFDSQMQALIDEEMSDRREAWYELNGCVRTMDAVTGEMTWVRR